MIAKRRDAAYVALQKEITRIAELQFSGVPVDEMRKYSEYINFIDCMQAGNNYPKDFKDNEKDAKYEMLGFVPSRNIPLLKEFPCQVGSYYIKVSDNYIKRYTTAIRKYMLLYFEAASNYDLILKSLEGISTDKQLFDDFPELLMFFDNPKKKEEKNFIVGEDTEKRCKELLKKWITENEK